MSDSTYAIIAESMAERDDQRYVNRANGSLTGVKGFIQRNNFTASNAVDSIAKNVTGRFDFTNNPIGAYKNSMAVANSFMAGINKAKLEAEQRKARQEAEAEERKLKAEQRRYDQETKRLSESSVSDFGKNVANAGKSFVKTMLPPTTMSTKIVSGNISPENNANVKTYTAADGTKMNVVTDTRSYGQRVADDWIAGIPKQMLGDLASQGVSYALRKGPEAAGYYGMRAKEKINSIMEDRRKKQEAKARADELKRKNAELRKIKTQKSQMKTGGFR